MDLQAVIFDLDGVLLDSFRGGLRRIKMLCAQEEIPFGRKERHALTEHWGMPAIELLQIGLGVNSKMAKEMNRRWILIDNSDPPSLVPGTRSALRWMRQNGFKSALLTSRHRDNVVSMLEQLDLEREFTCICAREDVRYHKPDPRSLQPPFEALQEQFHLKKDECVFVGDTPSDIEAGHAFEITTLVVQTGPYLLKHANKTFAGKQMSLQNILSSVDELPFWVEENHEGELRYLYD